MSHAMTSLPLNRRSALAGCAAAIAAHPASGQNASPAAFSSILVDVGPLRAKGLGPYAEAVQASLQAELARAFADRIRPGGARLVVRIDAISLSSYVGSAGSRRFGGGVSSDYLDGEALVLGPQGEILVRHPQLSALPSNSGGAWYSPGQEERRLDALTAHYAGWLRRGLS